MLKIKSNKWASIMEIGVSVAVMAILAGGAAVLVLPMLNKAKDAKVIEGLNTFSTAMQQYMTETNGDAPCLDGVSFEWFKSTGGICINNSYDVMQWALDAASWDLDEDANTQELITAYSLLIPKYLPEMPESAYKGDPMYYTKGLNDNNNYSDAFAFSGILRWQNADKEVVQNNSVLNALWTNPIENVTPTGNKITACKLQDLGATFNPTTWTEIVLIETVGGHAAGATSGSVDGSWYYYIWADLLDTATNDLVFTASAITDWSCDLYSKGIVKKDWFDAWSWESVTIVASRPRG